MATRAILTPLAAEFPASGFASLAIDGQDRPYLAFDDATSQAVAWTFRAPEGMVGTLTAVVTWRMASATSGNVVLRAQVEAITAGDTVDTDAASSYDTANGSGAVSVPGTAGYLKDTTVTLSNADSIAAGDYVRLRIDRDAANGSDTASGNLHILAVEFRDSA